MKRTEASCLVVLGDTHRSDPPIRISLSRINERKQAIVLRTLGECYGGDITTLTYQRDARCARGSPAIRTLLGLGTSLV